MNTGIIMGCIAATFPYPDRSRDLNARVYGLEFREFTVKAREFRA